MRSAEAWRAMGRAPWRFLLSRWPWAALLYLATSAVIGVLLIPILIFTFLLLPLWGVVVGALERRRMRLLGFPALSSSHTEVREHERQHWLSIRLSEAATWREAVAVILELVFGLAALVLLFAESIMLIALAMVAHAGITGPTETQFFGDLKGVMRPDNWWPVPVIALLILCVLAYLNTLFAQIQATLLRMLCKPRQREIDQHIERLLQSRRALLESSEAERRRIERDLHDGVQQELIALGASLGMIGLEIDDLAAQGIDASSALRAVEASQARAEHAMSTLRETVRGIHPSVLSDHGLLTALQELIERSAVPVELRTSSVGVLPPAIETAAYYFAAEALNNITKHSNASAVHASLDVTGDALTVEITDDGEGGADERTGSGLRGLRARAEALNGQFTYSSPAGGPTTLRMQLPLEHEGRTAHANPDR